MSVDASPARAPRVRTTADDAHRRHARFRRFGVPLVRLVEREPAIRFGVWLGADPSADPSAASPIVSLVWPIDTPLSDGVHALAVRAREHARVTRAPVRDVPLAGWAMVDELLAVPLSGDVAHVLVLGLRGADAAGRATLVRRVGRAFRTTARTARRVDPASASTPPSSLSPRAPSRAHPRTVRDRLDRAVLDASMHHGDGRAVALAAADTLATRLGCVRVSIGVGEGDGVVVLAISGESRPDARRALPRHLAETMTEASRHGGGRWPEAMVSDPVSDKRPATGRLAHRRLYESDGGLPLLSIVHDSTCGERIVALLERPVGRDFAADEEPSVAHALAPSLALIGRLHAAGRGIGSRLRACGHRRVRALREGPVTGRAGMVTMALAALACVALVPLPYRVGGRVLVEAGDRQVLVAPEAGHLRAAHARAGDTVVAGQLLATLDDRELALALDRWRGEEAKNRAVQVQALAGRDRVELARLRADAVRIAAERALVETRLRRREIRAPFDGVVLGGDPTRSLGAPVAAGEVLFEVGAGERSLSIEIDERDIRLVAAGARVEVRMAASPRDVRAARLEPIVPVAVEARGRQVFRVPARLLGDGHEPSPGMRGMARIEAGRRTLASAWTRRLRERLLLIGWRLGLIG